MAKRVKRVKEKALVKVTGMTRRPRAEMKVTHGRGEPVENRFLEYGAQPTREIRWELPPDWDGDLPLDPDVIDGSRIKPVVLVPDNVADQLDRHALRQRILDLGATYCKVPVVHVLRERVARDERHRTELSLEESLEIFAEETRPPDAEAKVAFAAELAREADAGEKE